ncbi:Nitrate/nitrite sensor protein NarX [Methyloligella halotolerans]|uniref:histidine kinase n=1 Tax=Methyloligella halotolerans TaxID=1177755 RepID=A0A1E2RUW4_9HYPH|nr:histidine kinase [Methyloligella halotolerans]ODA65925.1 Nitrate/nitrite sensor protein NarX [Methyloligella halotolerans]
MKGSGGIRLATPAVPGRAETPEQELKAPKALSRQPGAHGEIYLLNKVLTELLADPDSAEPFNLVLNHILQLSGAEAGAIFVSTESGRQLVLLACTETDERDRWIRLVHEDRDLYRSQRQGPEPVTRDDPEQTNATILAQGFEQGSSGNGLLLLRLPGTGADLSRDAIESAREYGDYLAGVLYSARSARMKLRNAQSEERAAIARELHDSLAQSLAYMKIQMSMLQTLIHKGEAQSDDAGDAMGKLRHTLTTASLQLRELITTFRLTMHGRTFAQALEDSIEEFEGRSSIAFDLDNRLSAGKLSVADEMQLLLILREALCNVVRHSHASYCWVSLRLKDEGAVHLTVDDNGVGAKPPTEDAQPHHGLTIMQERARSLGGSFAIEERAGGGTRLSVSLPPGTDRGGKAANVELPI